MKKVLLIFSGLILSSRTFAQAIFGSGIDTTSSEIEYWAPKVAGIGFLGVFIWCCFNKFSGQNRDVWGGVGIMLAYVTFCAIGWAAYDYILGLR